MENRFNFTKAKLESIKPRSKRGYFYDTKIRGLILDVTPNGVKTFRLYRKVNGRPERIQIGRFPDLTIDQARDKAETMNAEIAQGEDPGAERRSIRKEMKLGEMFALYLERYAKKHKRSWSGDEWLFNKYLSQWSHRSLSSIDQHAIERLHTAIGNDHGKYSANRVLSLLSGIYNKALDWGWSGTRNPAKGIQRFEEEERERFLHADELPRFFKAVTSELDTDARDAILLMLFTGARRTNVLSMRWQDVNLERAVWRIPLTKSGKAQSVTLAPVAIQVLSARQEHRKLNRPVNESDFVFPMKRVGKHAKEHRTEIKSAWDRIRKTAKIEDVRLHDLRRTLGSWQAAGGASLPIIGKSLGHADVSTTQIYARLDLDPVRAAVTAATHAMLTAGGLDNE